MTTTLNHPGGRPTFKLNNSEVPDGTVLLFGISYPGMGRTPKIFTYAMLKAGGLWYVTGTGRVPQAAGWGAVQNWLDRDNRRVEWVRAATAWADLYPLKVDGQSADQVIVDDPAE